MLSGGIVALAAGVAITLAGVREQLVWLMLVGTIISGIGFGAIKLSAFASHRRKLAAFKAGSCFGTSNAQSLPLAQ